MKYIFADHANNPKHQETNKMQTAMEVAQNILRTSVENEIILTVNADSNESEAMLRLIRACEHQSIKIHKALENSEIQLNIGMHEATRCNFSTLSV